ncbi:MAG: HEAT repeat domain-containing protein [Promethearchaeia archaeon]
MEEQNWQLMEVSEVNDKIIENLLIHLKINLSEEVFISVESLLKIGKKAESQIDDFLTRYSKSKKYHIALIQKISKYLKNEGVNPTLLKLYHPDFIIRAKAIMQLERKEILKNISLIIPCFTDPDDSVRFALVKSLINLDLINHRSFKSLLKNHCKKESNSVIRDKIKKHML